MVFYKKTYGIFGVGTKDGEKVAIMICPMFPGVAVGSAMDTIDTNYPTRW